MKILINITMILAIVYYWSLMGFISGKNQTCKDQYIKGYNHKQLESLPEVGIKVFETFNIKTNKSLKEKFRG